MRSSVPVGYEDRKLPVIVAVDYCLQRIFMAKQAGDFFIEGTIDDLTFYKMCGDYYVRMKSSLTGKRFWEDKAFEGSRRSCSRFGEGNKLASTVFKLVREERRTNGLFPFLRTKAIALLKEKKGAEEVIGLLLDYLINFGFIAAEPIKKTSILTSAAGEKNRELEMTQHGRCEDFVGLSGCFVDGFSPGLNSS